MNHRRDNHNFQEECAFIIRRVNVVSLPNYVGTNIKRKNPNNVKLKLQGKAKKCSSVLSVVINLQISQNF